MDWRSQKGRSSSRSMKASLPRIFTLDFFRTAALVVVARINRSHSPVPEDHLPPNRLHNHRAEQAVEPVTTNLNHRKVLPQTQRHSQGVQRSLRAMTTACPSLAQVDSGKSWMQLTTRETLPQKQKAHAKPMSGALLRSKRCEL